MKMGLTLWLCEVALSEGCQALVQGSWHVTLLLPGMIAGNRDEEGARTERPLFRSIVWSFKGFCLVGRSLGC